MLQPGPVISALAMDQKHILDQPTSGVLSFTANPVPPLKRIKLNQFGPSVQLQIVRWISSTLSGTILVTGDSQVLDPAAAKDAVRTSTVLSDDGFSDAVSETIRIAGLRLDSAIVKLVWLFWSMLDAGKRERRLRYTDKDGGGGYQIHHHDRNVDSIYKVWISSIKRHVMV